MKRWIAIVLAIAAALLAAAFSMLNEAVVRLDFFAFSIELPVGIVVTLSLLIGFLLASIVLALAVILPLRLRLRTLSRQLDQVRQQGPYAS